MIALIARMNDNKPDVVCEFPHRDAMISFVRSCSQRMVSDVVELEIRGEQKGKPHEVLASICNMEIEHDGAFVMNADMFDFYVLFK